MSQPSFTANALAPALAYPPSRRTAQVDVLHGVEVADPYRWLEDGTREDVGAWTAVQDALARAYLGKLPGRTEIAARLKELSYVETLGVPQLLGGRLFYTRRGANQEKASVYWREGQNGAEHVLLDPSKWSNDGSASLGVWAPSLDGRKVAYAMKHNNSDEATLHVMDVATGAVSTIDVIEGAKYAWPSWTPKTDGFYYTWLPPAGSQPAVDRPGSAEVRFHRLGTDPKTDETVHARTGDAKSFIGAAVDRSGRWLILTIEHGWTRTDVYFQDLRRHTAEWTPLAVGKDARYDVTVDRDVFFVWTNEDAPNGRVLRIDPARPDRAAWTEIVTQRSDESLEGLSIVGHRLALSYLKDIVSHLELRDDKGALVRELSLPEIGSASALQGEVEEDNALY